MEDRKFCDPSDSNDLLDCPFCGRKATVFKQKERWTSKTTVIYWGVGCTTQDCYGGQDSDLAYFESSHEAVKCWNKRAI